MKKEEENGMSERQRDALKGLIWGEGLIWGVVLTGLIMWGVLVSNSENDKIDFKEDAVKAGHAEYNSVTGKWQWKNLKEEK
jgi:hypothetical protein